LRKRRGEDAKKQAIGVGDRGFNDYGYVLIYLCNGTTSDQGSFSYLS